jgi:hypothetical protein
VWRAELVWLRPGLSFPLPILSTGERHRSRPLRVPFGVRVTTRKDPQMSMPLAGRSRVDESRRHIGYTGHFSLVDTYSRLRMILWFVGWRDQSEIDVFRGDLRRTSGG